MRMPYLHINVVPAHLYYIGGGIKITSVAVVVILLICPKYRSFSYIIDLLLIWSEKPSLEAEVKFKLILRQLYSLQSFYGRIIIKLKGHTEACDGTIHMIRICILSSHP